MLWKVDGWGCCLRCGHSFLIQGIMDNEMKIITGILMAP